MSTPSHVRFYANDWFTGTVGLKADERGVYISMCVYQWTIGRRVPLDDTEASRLMGLNFKSYQRLRDRLVVLGKIKRHENGYGNDRAERELAAAADAHARKSNGRAEPATDGRPNGQAAAGHPGSGSAPEKDAEADDALLMGKNVESENDPAIDPTIDPMIDPMIDRQIQQQNQHPLIEPEPEPKEREEEDPLTPKGEPLAQPLPDQIDSPLAVSAPAAPSRARQWPAELDAFHAWNAVAIANGLQQAARMTPQRRRSIATRMREHGPEGWQIALDRVAASRFLQGENDRGWRITLDWLISPKNFEKVVDGSYDPRPERNGHDRNHPIHPIAAALDRIERSFADVH